MCINAGGGLCNASKYDCRSARRDSIDDEFYFSIDQVRSALPEVRRWTERGRLAAQIGAAFKGAGSVAAQGDKVRGSGWRLMLICINAEDATIGFRFRRYDQMG